MAVNRSDQSDWIAARIATIGVDRVRRPGAARSGDRDQLVLTWRRKSGAVAWIPRHRGAVGIRMPVERQQVQVPTTRARQDVQDEMDRIVPATSVRLPPRRVLKRETHRITL